MEGSLTGFSIQDIFELLAMKKKTGVLCIDSPSEGQGRVWLREGRFSGAESTAIPGGGEGADPDGSHLRENLEETILAVLGWADGTYYFNAGEQADQEDGLALDVSMVLADVAKRRAEWEEIKKEIPSLRAKVELISRVEADAVTLTKNEWTIISLIGRCATVEEVQQESGQNALALCRTLLSMSKKGLIRCLGEVVESRPARGGARQETQSKSQTKKYIRRSLLADIEAEDSVPAEWASYYQLLDSRKVAAQPKRAGKAAEN